MLPGPVTGQSLQAVAWGTSEVGQGLRGVDDEEFAERRPLQLKGPAADALTFEDLVRRLVPKALDHLGSLTVRVITVKRYGDSYAQSNGLRITCGRLTGRHLAFKVAECRAAHKSTFPLETFAPRQVYAPVRRNHSDPSGQLVR